ncbi:helix-turn-helix domain containing protein [Morganella morganii]|nr:helix-turn-helix domain containing protein [Morganella morganii]
MIEETRTKLIRAARQQFGKAGYAATVMDDLTAQAGLTRGRCIITLVIKKGCFWRCCRTWIGNWMRAWIPQKKTKRMSGQLSNPVVRAIWQ